MNPGTLGVGTLTTTGLTLGTNGIVNFDFAATSNDLINVIGTNGLTLNGTAGSVKLNLYQNNTTTAFTTAGTYNLFEYVGAIGGTGLSALTDADLPFGYSATFGTASSGGNQYVTVTLGTSSVTVPTWALTGGGSWNVASDWTPPAIPNAVGQTALLGSAITAPSTVTLDGVQTIGTLAFNNANSYTVAAGSGGSLIFSNGSSAASITDALGNHSITAPISLASNLTASLTAGSVTLAGVISEATPGKTLTMSGAGTLALTNANTYTGGTFIGSGTVQVGNNAALGTGTLTFSSNGNLQAGAAGLAIPNNIAIASSATATIDTQAQTLTLSGVISSTDTTGGLTKIGSGTLIITGTNTLTNTVTVSAGTLQIGNGVTTGSFPGAIVNNATVAFNTAASYTDGNTLTGTGQVVQNAANTLTLSGANTFSGGLVINNNGTVVLAGNNNSDQAAGTGTITLNNGTLMVNGATGSTTPQYGPLTNTLNIPAGATGTVDNASRGDISSTLIGSGTLNFGTVYVRGTISGDWSRFTGSVNFGANAAGFPSSGDYRINTTNFNASNAFFTINTGGFVYPILANSTIQLGDLTGNGTIGSGGNGTLALNIGNIETAGVTTTFVGTITNGSGATSVIKNGAGILDLAGTNSFTGGLTVTNGTLEFLGASQYPTGITTIAMGAATTTGILDLNGFGSVNITSLSSTANANAGNNIVSSSSTSGSTAINFATGTSTYGGTLQDAINGGNQVLSLTINSGNLTLSGTNTFTGGTVINGGKLQLGAGGTTGSIVATAATTLVDNGTLAFNRSDNISFPAAIIGSGGITQAGPGILTLINTANAYSGTVTITGGTLQMVSGVALGNGSSPLVVTAGTLDLNGNSLTVGSLTGAAAGNIDNVAGGGSSTLTTGSLGANVTFAGTIKNTTGTVGLTKMGGGVLTLSGANTFSGAVDIQAGTIQLAGTGTLGSSAPVTVEAGAILDVNGVSTSLGSLNGAGTVDSVTSTKASVLTTGSLNATANFSGVIQNTAGTIALVKTGTGTLTLSSSNTFGGGTTINSGSLYVNNTAGSGLGSGAVTLNGGILGGTGAITGPVAAGSGAHSINPGAAAGAIGTLTVGALTTNANTTLGFDLSSPAGTSDLLAVMGNVDISAGATVAVTSQTVTGAASLGYYKVVSYAGTLTTGGTVVLPAAANNILYSLDTVHDAGFIDIHRGYIGDANDDGKVDLTDLNIILNNLGTTNTSWGKGNFDGAATIDLTDLNDVLNHLGTSIPSGAAVVATPEPASLGLLALGAAALIARRRKA